MVNLSLIGIEQPNTCGTQGIFTEVGTRIRDYTERFGEYGVVGDVCALTTVSCRGNAARIASGLEFVKCRTIPTSGLAHPHPEPSQ